MAGRASRGATHEELSAASGAACVHPEREWEVEAALRLSALEPVFEADFLDCWYGFRPGRNAHQALEEIRGHLQAGYQAVLSGVLRRPEILLRHDLARETAGVLAAPDSGPECIGSDPYVAGGGGRRFRHGRLER